MFGLLMSLIPDWTVRESLSHLTELAILAITAVIYQIKYTIKVTIYEIKYTVKLRSFELEEPVQICSRDR